MDTVDTPANDPTINSSPDIMGQKQSRPKPAINTSSISLLNKHISEPRTPSTPLTPLTPAQDISPPAGPITPIQDITPPAGPRELTRMSAIIDPRELIQDEISNVTPTRPKVKPGMVHSPSGHIMSTEEFLAHPNRPLAIWERQQKVIEATKAAVEKYEAECRLANQNKMGARLKKMRSSGDLKKKTKSKRTCGCWPF